MQLGDHALGELAHAARALDAGLRQQRLGLGAVEAGMDAGHIVDGLADPHPARQHRDIGDEADVAHERIALAPRVAAEHRELALVRDQPEDRVQGGGLARAVRSDQAKDTPGLDGKVDAGERDGRAVRLAEAMGFDARHEGSALLGTVSGRAEQLFRLEAEPLDAGENLRPLFREEFLPLAGQQALSRAGGGEHAKPPALLDQAVVDQLLVGLQHGERIDAVLGRDVTHRRQRIAVLEQPIQHHRHDQIAELAVDRLGIVPL